MNFGKNHITMLSIIGGMVLLIGLFAIVALVQRQQNIRSKASNQGLINEAFEVTDDKGKVLPPTDVSGVPTYETQSLDVKIKVKDLEKLAGEEQ